MRNIYVGTCFYRWFVADDGDGWKFLGTIKEVWWSTDVQKFYANVVYEDGDKEDIPVENLDTVLEKEETKPVLCVDSNNFACVMDSEEELPRKGNLKVDEPEALISGLLASDVSVSFDFVFEKRVEVNVHRLNGSSIQVLTTNTTVCLVPQSCGRTTRFRNDVEGKV